MACSIVHTDTVKTRRFYLVRVGGEWRRDKTALSRPYRRCEQLQLMKETELAVVLICRM